MNTVFSQVRIHRFLGCLAVLHAALLLIIGFIPGSVSPNWERLWVGLATVWFFWPFILVFHPAQSSRRVLVPLGLAAPFVFLWFRFYSFLAPLVFGLPEGMNLAGPSIWEYAVAYGAGWADARKEAKAGRLSLEAYGFGTITPGAPIFSAAVREQYRIEVTHVAGCVVNTRIMAHAKGHNDTTIKEIKRRFGSGIVAAAEEAEARGQREYKAAHDAGRAHAENDARAGRLAIEVFGSPIKGEANYERMLRERYQIELRRVNEGADPDMDDKIIAHANGYNEVSEAEIESRLGKEAINTIRSARARNSYENPGPEGTPF